MIDTSTVSLGICQWKNYENQSAFAEVMTKSQASCCFWDTMYTYVVQNSSHSVQ